VSLLASQQAFLAEISGEDEAVTDPSLGMEIYRNAYRARLVGALEASFERTRHYVGEAAFGQAAAHYVLTHAPRSWTLDLFGDAMPECLAELFAADPEVAELAWLEWHRQRAFAEPDQPQLDSLELAGAGLAGEDWARLTFTMAAGFAARAVTHDCAALWAASAEDTPGDFTLAAKPGQLIVWRNGLRPLHRQLSPDEWTSLERLTRGETFGAAAEPPPGHDEAEWAAAVGGWLAQWLQDGLFSGWALADLTPQAPHEN
jgi:hypothetical protein